MDPDDQPNQMEKSSSECRLHLLSKELEQATAEFLAKIAQLEQLLPLINE